MKKKIITLIISLLLVMMILICNIFAQTKEVTNDMYNHGQGSLTAGEHDIAASTAYLGNSVYPIWASATWSLSTHASAQDSSLNLVANVNGSSSVTANWSGAVRIF